MSSRTARATEKPYLERDTQRENVSLISTFRQVLFTFFDIQEDITYKKPSLRQKGMIGKGYISAKPGRGWKDGSVGKNICCGDLRSDP